MQSYIFEIPLEFLLKKFKQLLRRKKSGSVVFKDNRGGPKKFKFTEPDRMQVKNHIIRNNTSEMFLITVVLNLKGNTLVVT